MTPAELEEPPVVGASGRLGLEVERPGHSGAADHVEGLLVEAIHAAQRRFPVRRAVAERIDTRQKLLPAGQPGPRVLRQRCQGAHLPARRGDVVTAGLEGARAGGQEARAGHRRLLVVAGDHDVGRQRLAGRADRVGGDGADVGHAEHAGGVVSAEHVLRAAAVVAGGPAEVTHRANHRQLVGDAGGMGQQFGEADAGDARGDRPERAAVIDHGVSLTPGQWLSMGALAAGVPMGASHGIGYVLGAVFDVPHGHTSCIMLPSVMRWNKPANADRQALIANAMGHPGKDAGDVLDDFIRGLGMPRSLGEVKVGKEHFERIATQAMGTPWVPRNPRRIDGPAEVREILELAA